MKQSEQKMQGKNCAFGCLLYFNYGYTFGLPTTPTILKTKITIAEGEKVRQG